MLTLGYIEHFVAIHVSLVYILIVLGVILEGEIMVIFAGIFIHLGSVNVYLAFLSTLVGGSIKSVLGYSIGNYLQQKHSHRKFLIQAENRVNHFLPNFIKKPFISIFLSRFLVLGMYWFSLIYAGYKKINIRIYIKAEALSLVVWSTVMLSLGAFFSYTALSVGRDVRKFMGVLLLCFILFFILEKVIAFIIELFEIQEVE